MSRTKVLARLREGAATESLIVADAKCDRYAVHNAITDLLASREVEIDKDAMSDRLVYKIAARQR